MQTLVPTVNERLARCGTSVYLTGLVTGANVVLSVGGVQTPAVATGGDMSFAVAGLAPGASVKAKQDAGAGFTPWSPTVTVEDAAVPPAAGPQLPAQVGSCSQCVLVSGCVPESGIELLVGSDVVGKGTAGLDGSNCVAVDLTKVGKKRVALSARMIVCGRPGPLSSTPLVPDPALPKPVIGTPLFGCQSVVPLTNLRAGSVVQLEATGPSDLGSVCSCWTAVNVGVNRNLVTGTKVQTRQFWDTKPCQAEGPWSDEQPVVAPDDRIKPVILPPLFEGDRIIRVDNQVPGATLVVRILPKAATVPDEFGPRPASQRQEVALNAPLKAGNVVTVVQSLCGVSFESDPVTAEPRPLKLTAPVVLPPLLVCGAAVQVSNVHPGATVRVFLDGIPIGLQWSGNQVSVSVPVSPSLSTGKVTARQWLGSLKSPLSKPPVPVQSAKSLHQPRVLAPVAQNDTEICVSGVTPGSHISIRSGAAILGEANAAESFVRLPVAPVSGPVHAEARLCTLTAAGGDIAPIAEPNAAGPFANTAEKFLAFAKWHVPATTDGHAFDTPIEGQLYFPSTPDGKFANAENLPLVLIAHGFYTPGIKSYTGYDYLAHHLASWGMVVFSLNMDEVNNKTGTGSSQSHQYSRGEMVLHIIDMLLGSPDLRSRINRQSIGLIGHSVGGEGVVAAQFLNDTGARGYGIRAVVSIAPTNYRSELLLRNVKYLQLLGSMDLLVNDPTALGPHAQFGGTQIYDRAWRPKTHVWVRKARHNPFNRVWVANGDHFEDGIDAIALPHEAHERIAKAFINALFQDALRGQAGYAGYMEGTILPPSVRDIVMSVQHSQQSRTVLDNFGDADTQVPLPAVAPLDKTKNSLNQAANASGAGIAAWNDVQLSSLTRCPHDTAGSQMSWNTTDAGYSSLTGGLAFTNTDVIALRIAQLASDTVLNPVDVPADVYVAVRDGATEAIVRLGTVNQVGYPFTGAAILSMLQTIRLPLDAFEAAAPGFNVAAIQSIKLSMIARDTGNILIDDLELGS